MSEEVKSIDILQKEILEAAENNCMEVLKSLLDTNPTLVNCTDEDGYSPLHRASYNNHTDIIKFLLSRGAKIDSCTNDGWQPIHCAARWNNADTAAILLANKPDIINAQTHGGLTPLHVAASQQDSREILILLLSNSNIDPTILNSIGETANCIAQRSGRLAHLFKMVEPSINEMTKK